MQSEVVKCKRLMADIHNIALTVYYVNFLFKAR